MERRISDSVVNRLPRYYRYLNDLLLSGTERISSKELSDRMGVTASQIRQDLNCFGGFGQQGYGYNVQTLHREIANILGLNNGYTAILVGAGNMGRTFAANTKFEARGFRLLGIFDVAEEKIGTEIRDQVVRDYRTVGDFVREYRPDMAILAVPKGAMHAVAQDLMELGIKAFLNFSYTELTLKDDIAVENIHLSDSLMRLSYKIKEKKRAE